VQPERGFFDSAMVEGRLHDPQRGHMRIMFGEPPSRFEYAIGENLLKSFCSCAP